MDQQLRLAEHLSTCVIGNTCVDTSIMWRHVSQHQGISSSILSLAQPGTVHQLGAVLNKQETGWATISLSWDMPAPGLTHPPWSSTSNTCCVPIPRSRPDVGWEDNILGCRVGLWDGGYRLHSGVHEPPSILAHGLMRTCTHALQLLKPVSSPCCLGLLLPCTRSLWAVGCLQ